MRDLLSMFFEQVIDVLAWSLTIIITVVLIALFLASLGMLLFGWLHTWWWSVAGFVASVFFCATAKFLCNLWTEWR